MRLSHRLTQGDDQQTLTDSNCECPRIPQSATVAWPMMEGQRCRKSDVHAMQSWNRARGLFCASIALLLLGFTPSWASAQQNLFNVPNGQITNLGEVFFQQQFNFTPKAGSSNTTFDFGLGHGWEIGFNLLDLNIYDSAPAPAPFARTQENPDLMLNFQKGFEIVDDFWSLGVGGQFGINPARQTRDVRFENFTWLINSIEIPEIRGKAYVGAYYANVAYGGPGDRFGALLGLEIEAIKERLSFQADCITGNREISVIVVGGVVTFPNKWQLSIGSQLPTPRSHNPYGVVIELTQPGFRLFSRRPPPEL